MNELPRVVLVGKVTGMADGPEDRTWVLPEPLDFRYLASKQPDMVIIFDCGMPGSAREYARLLRTRGIVPGATLVAAYPNGHMPDARELRRAGIVLAVSEAEVRADLGAVFTRATQMAETAKLVQMPLLQSNPRQAEMAFAVAVGGGPAWQSSDATTNDRPESSAFVGKERAVTNTASSLAAVPRQTTCLQCKRWRPAPNDKFCAWCGARLVRLKCDPTELSFRTDQKETKGSLLTLHNDGINTLFASVEVVAPPEIRKRFRILPEEKQGAVEVPGGTAESLTIVFDASSINPTFDYSAALEILTNVDEPAIRVPLRVEGPPIARLVFPPAPQNIVYGDPAKLRLSVRNTGGGVLEVEGIKLQQYGYSKLTAEGSIAAGQKELPLEIALDLEKLKAGDYVARGQVLFRNHAEAPFAIEFAFAKPPRMRLTQDRLQLEVYNIGRKQHREIKFENIGAESLKILSIKAESEWLSALCRIKEFAPGNDGYIDIFVDATSLLPGSYSGELSVQTNGYDRNLRVAVDLSVQEKAALKEAVGIDFGTSVSCAAIVQNNKPVLIPLDRSAADGARRNSLPSVVFFTENFFPLVGEEAQTRAKRDPAAAIRSVKRILGTRRRILIRDQEKSPEEVTTEILRALLSAVETSPGLESGSPVQALLTVPADISDEQIKGVLVSAKQAGLKIENADTSEYVIDEPSAAAMYYLWKLSQQGECQERELVFIYDFGAGTLDCSLVEITNQNGNLKIQVLATAGDPRLGGDDIDLLLAQSIAKRLGATAGSESHPVLAREEDLLALAKRRTAVSEAIEMFESARSIRENARMAAEQIKITLSQASKATQNFPAANGTSTEVTVTRAEFEALLTDFIERSNQVVIGCCNIAGRKAEEVNTLLQTGRGSLIPKLREQVRELFPSAHDNSELIKAKECVALGAAWWAHIKNFGGRASIEVEGVGRVLPNTICYTERVPGSVAVANVPVFHAGERFPLERTVEVLATQKGKKWRLDICEKRFGSDDEVRPRGSVELAAQADAQTYKATFSINLNRILEVSVGGKTLQIEPADDDNLNGRGRR